MKPPSNISIRIRELMEAICHTQQLRSDEFKRIKEEALSKLPNTLQANYEANGVAYSGTQDKADLINRLLQTLYEDILQLKEEHIRKGDPATIERLLAFLYADIPAFQCGYGKEYYLRILKNADLTRTQQKEFQSLVLFHCHSQHFRREYSSFARLAIRLADAAFVRQLQILSASPDVRAQIKAKFMLDRILNSRQDLRPVQNSSKISNESRRKQQSLEVRFPDI